MTETDGLFYYAPYNPFGVPYKTTRKITDVDGIWYTVITMKHEVDDWIVELPMGSWRYSANRRMVDLFSGFDLREDVYQWFLLRWS
jgi:hypothetical protein